VLAHIHPSPFRFAYEPVPLRGSAHPGSVSRCSLGSRNNQVPRAPLPLPSVTCSGETFRPIRGRYPSFIALTDSCARPPSSLLLGSRLVWRVFAGCSQSLLDGGPSRRYLCKSFLGCLAPYPGASSGASARFFPEDFGLPRTMIRSAFSQLPRAATSARRYISRLQAFLYVQASKFACHPGRSDRYDIAVWPPWRLLPNLDEFVSSLPVGYANCPNRAIDSRGLSPH